VIDDDRAIREGMRELLAEVGYSVEVFADGAAFFQTTLPYHGCVLVDAVMPIMSGIEIIEKLRAAGQMIPAIVVTGRGDVGMAVKAMKAGAIDFIEKPANPEGLLAIVAHALSSARGAEMQSATHAAAEISIAGLSPRQRQILELVLEGLPSKNIAADLGISQRTVDNHRAAIMKKTGSKTLSALIRVAIAAA
jgi:two-component system CheB/CheR fusion protein